MSAPRWLNAILREFGEGVDIKNFGLNAQDAASMVFETGVSLRFEYAFESLVIAIQIPVDDDPGLMKRLLIYAQPERSRSFRLRVAYLEKVSSAIMAVIISERDASLASVNAIFTELWLMAEEFRRRAA